MLRTKWSIIQNNIRMKLEREHNRFRRSLYPDLPYSQEYVDDHLIITKVFDTPMHLITTKYVNGQYINIDQ